MKKIFKGINIILSVVLVLIALGVAYVAFPQFGNQALIVRSGSMTPTIDIGSIVVARPTENVTYKKGDVIAFRSEKNSKTIITHRVAEVESGPDGVFYKTKGDANKSVDGWSVSEKNVLGKVGLTIPYAGRVLTFAKSDIGFPMLIILPAIIVILVESISIFKEIRKRKKNNETFGFDQPDPLRQSSSEASKQKPAKKFNLIGFKILIPILAFSLIVPTALAFLNDTEISANNIFQASSVFPTATPSVSPTPSVIPSVTPIPPQQATIYVSDPFTCAAGASNTTTSRGTVTITKDSSLDVSVTLTGALPNATYELWVNQDPGACPLPSPTVSSFITTDGSGNGSNTLNNHPLAGGATNFWVSLVSGSDVLRSTAVSF